MNIQEELTGWSDNVLTILVQEENCSEEFRQCCLAELESRPHSQVTLSSHLLHEAATNGIGWTRKQLDVLGVHWPPKHGWIKNLEGLKIPLWQWNKFLAMKGVKKSTSFSRERSQNPTGYQER